MTFDNTSVNVGGAFDVTTGFFTAPYAGIYGFNFHALTRDGSGIDFLLSQNFNFLSNLMYFHGQNEYKIRFSVHCSVQNKIKKFNI